MSRSQKLKAVNLFLFLSYLYQCIGFASYVSNCEGLFVALNFIYYSLMSLGNDTDKLKTERSVLHSTSSFRNPSVAVGVTSGTDSDTDSYTDSDREVREHPQTESSIFIRYSDTNSTGSDTNSIPIESNSKGYRGLRNITRITENCSNIDGAAAATVSFSSETTITATLSVNGKVNEADQQTAPSERFYLDSDNKGTVLRSFHDLSYSDSDTLVNDDLRESTVECDSVVAFDSVPTFYKIMACLCFVIALFNIFLHYGLSDKIVPLSSPPSLQSKTR